VRRQDDKPPEVQTPAPPPITQNADIRYLGRLLGDVIRGYGGPLLFERTEAIRASSVERHRGSGDAAAFNRHLDALSLDETLAFVRGFMLFSMLANLAEDRQGRHDAGLDVAAALRQLAEQGIEPERAAALLDHALIVPVLTAHPTEVMRKSMLDHRNRIAELMRLRDAGARETPDGDVIEQAIVRQIALLWETRPLRRERMQVQDEVQIALSYLRDVFLPVLPQLYSRWERLLPRRPGCFLRLGSWIGGDRDGNPNVTAESLHYALRQAAQAVLNAYLERCTCWARSCRSRPSSRPPRMASWRSPRQAATTQWPAATSPIDARSAASMPASPPPTRPSPASSRRACRSRQAGLTRARRSCATTSPPSPTASRISAPGCWPRAARWGG
jgi:hypothetical protein